MWLEKIKCVVPRSNTSPRQNVETTFVSGGPCFILASLLPPIWFPRHFGAGKICSSAVRSPLQLTLISPRFLPSLPVQVHTMYLILSEAFFQSTLSKMPAFPTPFTTVHIPLNCFIFFFI